MADSSSRGIRQWLDHFLFELRCAHKKAKRDAEERAPDIEVKTLEDREHELYEELKVALAEEIDEDPDFFEDVPTPVELRHALDDYGECDGCEKEKALAITESGRYCSRCLPENDLARLLDDLE